MANKVLFLTLHTFSLTGGIEKVCRAMSKALTDLRHCEEERRSNLNNISSKSTPLYTKPDPTHLSNRRIEGTVFSMYDKDSDLDTRYINRESFKGFSGTKLKFISTGIQKGLTADTIILSHINLLLVAFLIKLFAPSKRIIVFAHGIEVWRPLSTWKKNFLKKCQIWAVSNYTAQRLQTHQGIRKENITVVNNCLDPFLEVPANFDKPQKLLKRYKLAADQRVLFTLTRLSSREGYKGYDRVLESMLNLLQIYPNVHYILAGKTDAVEKARLKQLIQIHNLTDHVTFAGFISDEEVNDHFLLSDLFVMPSYGEGFGIVFIEAAACGANILAGNKDGSVDALLNGELGMLVDPECPAELRDAIMASLGQSRNEEYCKGIQQKCLNNFNFQRYKQKISVMLSGVET